jgi:hypothetical protein
MRTKFKFLAVSVFVLTGLVFNAYPTYAFSAPWARG